MSVAAKGMDLDENLAENRVLFTEKLFDELDFLGTRKPFLVASIPDMPQSWDRAPHLKNLILPLQDPQNLGLCLRAAAAFGMDQVLLTLECASAFLPRSLRAGGLAAYSLKLFSLPLRIAELDSQIFPEHSVFVLDGAGEDARQVKLRSEGFTLLVGQEGEGTKRVPRNFKRLRLEQSTEVESLNAAQAVTLALYSLTQLC